MNEEMQKPHVAKMNFSYEITFLFHEKYQEEITYSVQRSNLNSNYWYLQHLLKKMTEKIYLGQGILLSTFITISQTAILRQLSEGSAAVTVIRRSHRIRINLIIKSDGHLLRGFVLYHGPLEEQFSVLPVGHSKTSPQGLMEKTDPDLHRERIGKFVIHCI